MSGSERRISLDLVESHDKRCVGSKVPVDSKAKVWSNTFQAKTYSPTGFHYKTKGGFRVSVHITARYWLGLYCIT